MDGRPVPITFFENIVAGSLRDRLARAAVEPASAGTGLSASAPSFRQRTVVFFLDDRHLSLDSIGRTRRMLLDFIDKEMGEGDLVAVASASGRISFLRAVHRPQRGFARGRRTHRARPLRRVRLRPEPRPRR